MIIIVHVRVYCVYLWRSSEYKVLLGVQQYNFYRARRYSKTIRCREIRPGMCTPDRWMHVDVLDSRLWSVTVDIVNSTLSYFRRCRTWARIRGLFSFRLPATNERRRISGHISTRERPFSFAYRIKSRLFQSHSLPRVLPHTTTVNVLGDIRKFS